MCEWKGVNMSAKRDWTVMLLCCLVPAVALGIFGRQLVLQRVDNISIWEGGGMGMFAEIGGFARVVMPYLVDAGGNRHPIVDLDAYQTRIAGFARKRPTEENLSSLAALLARSSWVAVAPPAPRLVVDREGDVTGSTGVQQLLLVPAGSPGVSAFPERVYRPSSDGESVIVEYWEIRYDPETRIASRTLISEVSR